MLTYVIAEQEARMVAFTADDLGILWHEMTASPPRSERLDADLASALCALVAPSPGGGEPRRRRWRGTRDGLADLVLGIDRITTLSRSDVVEGAYVDGFLAVLDGGPGRLWLVTETDDDHLADPAAVGRRAVVAEPASSSEVMAAIRNFGARRVLAWAS